jgi:solute carrier family 35 (UDP-sugar transporter), member A1/2/3
VLKKPSVSTDAKVATKPAASLWMRNIQLSAISIVIALMQSMFQDPNANNPNNGEVTYLHGFTFWTWVLVLLQAAGGLLVAAVIKYADNVLKGLATGVSVVFATAASMVLFGTPLTGQFFIGAVMILVSVYYFSNPLPNNILSHVKRVQDSVMNGGNGNGTINGRSKDDESKVEIKSLLPK